MDNLYLSYYIFTIPIFSFKSIPFEEREEELHAVESNKSGTVSTKRHPIHRKDKSLKSIKGKESEEEAGEGKSEEGEKKKPKKKKKKDEETGKEEEAKIKQLIQQIKKEEAKTKGKESEEPEMSEEDKAKLAERKKIDTYLKDTKAKDSSPPRPTAPKAKGGFQDQFIMQMIQNPEIPPLEEEERPKKKAKKRVPISLGMASAPSAHQQLMAIKREYQSGKLTLGEPSEKKMCVSDMQAVLPGSSSSTGSGGSMNIQCQPGGSHHTTMSQQVFIKNEAGGGGDAGYSLTQAGMGMMPQQQQQEAHTFLQSGQGTMHSTAVPAKTNGNGSLMVSSAGAGGGAVQFLQGNTSLARMQHSITKIAPAKADYNLKVKQDSMLAVKGIPQAQMLANSELAQVLLQPNPPRSSSGGQTVQQPQFVLQGVKQVQPSSMSGQQGWKLQKTSEGKMYLTAPSHVVSSASATATTGGRGMVPSGNGSGMLRTSPPTILQAQLMAAKEQAAAAVARSSNGTPQPAPTVLLSSVSKAQAMISSHINQASQSQLASTSSDGHVSPQGTVNRPGRGLQTSPETYKLSIAQQTQASLLQLASAQQASSSSYNPTSAADIKVLTTTAGMGPIVAMPAKSVVAGSRQEIINTILAQNTPGIPKNAVRLQSVSTAASKVPAAAAGGTSQQSGNGRHARTVAEQLAVVKSQEMHLRLLQAQAAARQAAQRQAASPPDNQANNKTVVTTTTAAKLVAKRPPTAVTRSVVSPSMLNRAVLSQAAVKNVQLNQAAAKQLALSQAVARQTVQSQHMLNQTAESQAPASLDLTKAASQQVTLNLPMTQGPAPQTSSALFTNVGTAHHVAVTQPWMQQSAMQQPAVGSLSSVQQPNVGQVGLGQVLLSQASGQQSARIQTTKEQVAPTTQVISSQSSLQQIAVSQALIQMAAGGQTAQSGQYQHALPRLISQTSGHSPPLLQTIQPTIQTVPFTGAVASSSAVTASSQIASSTTSQSASNVQLVAPFLSSTRQPNLVLGAAGQQVISRIPALLHSSGIQLTQTGSIITPSGSPATSSSSTSPPQLTAVVVSSLPAGAGGSSLVAPTAVTTSLRQAPMVTIVNNQVIVTPATSTLPLSTRQLTTGPSTAVPVTARSAATVVMVDPAARRSSSSSTPSPPLLLPQRRPPTQQLLQQPAVVVEAVPSVSVVGGSRGGAAAAALQEQVTSLSSSYGTGSSESEADDPFLSSSSAPAAARSEVSVQHAIMDHQDYVHKSRSSSDRSSSSSERELVVKPPLSATKRKDDDTEAPLKKKVKKLYLVCIYIERGD